MNDMKPNAEEFHGPPIYCPSETCDFTTTSQRGLRYKGFLCPKCGAELKKRTVLAPNHGESLQFTLSCVDCANFERTTICTGFGAKLEGRCNVYCTGICSYDTICDAIDSDPEEKARDLARSLVMMPRGVVDTAIEAYNVNNQAKDLPKDVEVMTMFHLREKDTWINVIINRTDDKKIVMKGASDAKKLVTLLWMAGWDVTDETMDKTK